MAKENTHSDLVAASGGTAAARTSLGTITLPAGGPWLIHNVYGLIARATGTAAQAVTGALEVVSVSGDIDPNPAPSMWPLMESGASLGATLDATTCPLQMYPVSWTAEGKSVLQLYWTNDAALTVAPRIIAGIMYGKTAPNAVPLIFSGRARAAVTTAVENTIGTIQLSEKAQRITGICPTVIQHNVLTTAEELIGYIRLGSDDVDLTPFRIPFLWASGAGLGALIQGADNFTPWYIPLDIPVEKGARITVYCTLSAAVTNAAEVDVYLAYE